MQSTKAVRKYLTGHAEAESRLTRRLAEPFAHAIVVPAYGEGDGVLRTLRSVPAGPHGPVLIVLVINEPPAGPEHYAEANRATFSAIEAAYGPAEALYPHVRRHEHPSGVLVVIDRIGDRAIPSEQGVGLARKIGLDFALAAAVTTSSNPAWLHGTDADAILPPDYFQAVDPVPDAAALVHPFAHATASPVGPAVHAYEASLRYYVLGLRHARSKYAFHTIGSLVSVTPQAYASVRGVPKRNGAEDFYLLNKVRKIGHVASLDTTPIVLSGRASGRVPFGTGPAVTKIAKTGDPWAFPVYHPAIFDRLREHLAQGAELDAKQTLKFVHAVRDDAWCSIPLRDAVEAAPFVPNTPTRDLASLCERLATLERTSSSADRGQHLGHGVGDFVRQ